jgi:chloramphenicol O-acetyltransferase type A
MTTNYQRLDLTNWPRKQHFEFYKDFAQPYFSIGCDLDASKLYHHCKNPANSQGDSQGDDHKIAFFDAYLFLTMQAINQVEPFRYRLVDGQVRIYPHISISVAIMAEDNTFRFCEVPFASDFATFQSNLKAAKAEAISGPFFSEMFAANKNNQATVHMSVIPWISFTSFGHARHGGPSTGIPLIAMGKMREKDCSMPICVDAHHALVDGVDVGQFVGVLQGLFDEAADINIH